MLLTFIFEIILTWFIKYLLILLNVVKKNWIGKSKYKVIEKKLDIKYLKFWLS